MKWCLISLKAIAWLVMITLSMGLLVVFAAGVYWLHWSWTFKRAYKQGFRL